MQRHSCIDWKNCPRHNTAPANPCLMAALSNKSKCFCLYFLKHNIISLILVKLGMIIVYCPFGKSKTIKRGVVCMQACACRGVCAEVLTSQRQVVCQVVREPSVTVSVWFCDWRRLWCFVTPSYCLLGENCHRLCLKRIRSVVCFLQSKARVKEQLLMAAPPHR